MAGRGGYIWYIYYGVILLEVRESLPELRAKVRCGSKGLHRDGRSVRWEAKDVEKKKKKSPSTIQVHVLAHGNDLGARQIVQGQIILEELAEQNDVAVGGLLTISPDLRKSTPVSEVPENNKERNTPF